MRTFARPQKLQRDEDEVVKIEGVGLDEPLLVNRVYLLQLMAGYDAAPGWTSGLGCLHVLRHDSFALKLRDHGQYDHGLCLGGGIEPRWVGCT